MSPSSFLKVTGKIFHRMGLGLVFYDRGRRKRGTITVPNDFFFLFFFLGRFLFGTIFLLFLTFLSTSIITLRYSVSSLSTRQFFILKKLFFCVEFFFIFLHFVLSNLFFQKILFFILYYLILNF